MKQLLLSLALVWLGAGAMAQTISELNFPYKEGLQLNYEGTKLYYDAEGDIKDTVEFSAAYEVFDAPDTGEEDIVRFRIFTADGQILDNSYLYTNEKGMYWWFDREDSKSELTQAIKLPLKEGKKWGGYFGESKAKFKCTGTNVDINTNAGTYKGFVIETTLYSERPDGVKFKHIILEYYNQDLGKIRSEDQMYVEVGKKAYKMVLHEVRSISSYQLPDGTKSN